MCLEDMILLTRYYPYMLSELTHIVYFSVNDSMTASTVTLSEVAQEQAGYNLEV